MFLWSNEQSRWNEDTLVHAVLSALSPFFYRVWLASISTSRRICLCGRCCGLEAGRTLEHYDEARAI